MTACIIAFPRSRISRADALPAGAGVWWRHTVDGCTTHRRGHVIAREHFGGRYLVVDIDAPRIQAYVPRARLTWRYAGEIAPGVTEPTTAGRGL